MESNDYIELQILLAKLKKATRKAAITDKSFKKYHQSSIDVLETIPQHFTALQQGLSIVQPLTEETKEVYKDKEELELSM